MSIRRARRDTTLRRSPRCANRGNPQFQPQWSAEKPTSVRSALARCSVHPGGDLGAGSEAKPAKNVGDVVLDCLGSHEKPLGNLRVRQPFREQWNDIALATAQYLEPAAACGVSNSTHTYAEGAEQRGHTVGVASSAESLEDGQSCSGLGGRAGDI